MAKAKMIEPATKQDVRAAVLKHTSPNKGFNQAGEKRAGSNHVEATGHHAGAEGTPMMSPKGASFNSAGTARNGNNHVQATGHPGAAGECPVTC
jgi:hypothetical protein